MSFAIPQTKEVRQSFAEESGLKDMLTQEQVQHFVETGKLPTYNTISSNPSNKNNSDQFEEAQDTYMDTIISNLKDDFVENGTLDERLFKNRISIVDPKIIENYIDGPDPYFKPETQAEHSAMEILKESTVPPKYSSADTSQNLPAYADEEPPAYSAKSENDLNTTSSDIQALTEGQAGDSATSRSLSNTTRQGIQLNNQLNTISSSVETQSLDTDADSDIADDLK